MYLYVCMCVYMCMYVYICIYVCACMCVYVYKMRPCKHVSMYLHRRASIKTHVFLCI